MGEIKPVYQLKYATGCIDITEEQYFRESYMRGTPRRILYPAAAYEALKAENEALRKIKEAAENLFSHKDNYHNEQKVIALTNALAKSNEGDRE